MLSSILDQLDNQQMMWLIQAQVNVRKEFNHTLELANPGLMQEILAYAIESKTEELSVLYGKLKAVLPH